MILIALPYALQSHPGGLLFTKFGSNQTVLLDLAFLVCTTFFPIVFSFGFLFLVFGVVPKNFNGM